MKIQIGALLGFLWLQICGVRGQTSVEQHPGVLVVQEGNNSSLVCNFSFSMTSVQWFQQSSGGQLVSLFYTASEVKHKGRLTCIVSGKKSYTQLNIRDSQPEDSTMYFCAVEAQCSPDTCSPYTISELGTSPHPKGREGLHVIHIAFP